MNRKLKIILSFLIIILVATVGLVIWNIKLRNLADADVITYSNENSMSPSALQIKENDFFKEATVPNEVSELFNMMRELPTFYADIDKGFTNDKILKTAWSVFRSENPQYSTSKEDGYISRRYYINEMDYGWAHEKNDENGNKIYVDNSEKEIIASAISEDEFSYYAGEYVIASYFDKVVKEIFGPEINYEPASFNNVITREKNPEKINNNFNGDNIRIEYNNIKGRYEVYDNSQEASNSFFYEYVTKTSKEDNNIEIYVKPVFYTDNMFYYSKNSDYFLNQMYSNINYYYSKYYDYKNKNTLNDAVMTLSFESFYGESMNEKEFLELAHKKYYFNKTDLLKHLDEYKYVFTYNENDGKYYLSDFVKVS